MKINLAQALGILLLSVTVATAGQQRKIEPSKEAHIRELLQVTGMKELVERQMGQMADQIKPLLEKSMPPGEQRHDIVEEFMRRFRARANSQELIEQIIPVYDKYLTDEDVKAVLQFYKSPEGQRLLKVMPDMMREASIAGQEWGQQIAREVVQQMAQEYPELRQQQ